VRGGKRPGNSSAWLRRQATDPFVKAAKAEGYRSRAAYKLIALAEKYRLFKPGQRVVDLGAAPGGWLQVAGGAIGDTGRLVAVDLSPMDGIAGAVVIQADVAEPGLAARIIAALGGRAAIVLSDMAPSTTGHVETDHMRIVGLAEAALELASEVLAPGGAFVVKLRMGGGEAEFFRLVRTRFTTVARAKPPASRSESSELYVVARGFKP
jgi:23S rRNA (uridine2552-2'-O)-methyltransferase